MKKKTEAKVIIVDDEFFEGRLVDRLKNRLMAVFRAGRHSEPEPTVQEEWDAYYKLGEKYKPPPD